MCSREFFIKPKIVPEVELKVEKTLYRKNVKNETVALLSLKYNLSPEKISGVFFDYCDLTGLNCDVTRHKELWEAKKSIEEAVEEISSKYNITKEMFANLIIDERRMREVDSECVLPSSMDDYVEENRDERY